MQTKVLRWVDANKNFLFLSFAAGILFFGALAGLTAWRKNQEEKAQEALYKAKGEKGALLQITKDFPKSKAALLSFLVLAVQEFEAKNTAGCVENYKKLYESSQQLFLFRVSSLHGMAACYEAKENFKEACPLYKRAAKEPGHVSPWFSRLEEARCLARGMDPLAKVEYAALLQEKGIPADWKEKIEGEGLWLQLKEGF